MSEYLINQSGRCFSAPVKPNPLEGEIKMRGIDIEKHSEEYASRYSGAFDGSTLWIAPSEYSQLTGINVKTEEQIYCPLSIANNYKNNLCCFDGSNLWVIPTAGKVPAHKYNVDVGNFTVYPQSGAHQDRYGRTVYDGECIWYSAINNMVKFNPLHGEMIPVEIPGFSWIITFAYDGQSLWLYATTTLGDKVGKLIELDPRTGQVKTVINTGYDQSDFKTMICTGESLWLLPYKSNKTIVKFDIQTQEFHSYTAILGQEKGMTAQNVFAAAYDGKYIWMAPDASNHLFRMDTDDGSLTSFEFQGENIGSWTTGTSKCVDMCFDGGSLWLIPLKADKLLRISGDHLSDLIVTVEYRDTQGNELLPSNGIKTRNGTSYNGTGLPVDGYTCIGHRVDNGTLQSGSTATILNVQQDHTVTFVYRKTDDGTDPDPAPQPGNNSCCCCGSLKLELNIPISNNREMLQELKELVQAAKGCDNSGCHTKEE